MTVEAGDHLARRIRAARELAGLRSVEALVEAIDQKGLGRSVIREAEQGKRGLVARDLAAVADACQVPYAFFDMDFFEAAGALRERSEVRRLREDLDELREESRRRYDDLQRELAVLALEVRTQIAASGRAEPGPPQQEPPR